MVRNSLFPDCALIVQGKKGWPSAWPGAQTYREYGEFKYCSKLCRIAMFLTDVLGVGYGQVFCVQCLFVLRVARKHGLV